MEKSDLSPASNCSCIDGLKGQKASNAATSINSFIVGYGQQSPFVLTGRLEIVKDRSKQRSKLLGTHRPESQDSMSSNVVNGER